MGKPEEGGKKMPVVTVKMFRGRTKEQKKDLVEKITRAVCEAVNVKPEDVIVIIEEMEKEHYAVGGRTFDEEKK